jgi:hypothetical protein
MRYRIGKWFYCFAALAIRSTLAIPIFSASATVVNPKAETYVW